MSNGTPCSSQLIWCETQVEKLEQQLIEWKELARNIDAQLRTELAAETNNKQEFERDWLACCDKLNDERRIHLELEETLVKKLEAAQAREKLLRDALKAQPCNLRTVWKDGIDLDLPDRATEIRDAALAMPADDTAIKSLLKAERERCLAECEKIHARGFRETAFECIEAILALEDK